MWYAIIPYGTCDKLPGIIWIHVVILLLHTHDGRKFPAIFCKFYVGLISCTDYRIVCICLDVLFIFSLLLNINKQLNCMFSHKIKSKDIHVRFLNYSSLVV